MHAILGRVELALTSVYAVVRIHYVVVVVIDATSVLWATLSGRASGRRYASRGPAVTRITAVAQLRAAGVVAVISLVRLLPRRQSVVGVLGRLVSGTCGNKTDTR